MSTGVGWTGERGCGGGAARMIRMCGKLYDGQIQKSSRVESSRVEVDSEGYLKQSRSE